MGSVSSEKAFRVLKFIKLWQNFPKSLVLFLLIIPKISSVFSVESTAESSGSRIENGFHLVCSCACPLDTPLEYSNEEILSTCSARNFGVTGMLIHRIGELFLGKGRRKVGPLQKLQHQLQNPENAQNLSVCLLQEHSFAFSLWSDSIVA